MISITIAMALSMSSALPQANPSAQPRKAYAGCISKFTKKSVAEKMEAAAFEAALKTACQPEETALRTSLIAFETGLGAKRAEADESAKLQIEDYRAAAIDTFKAGA